MSEEKQIIVKENEEIEIKEVKKQEKNYKEKEIEEWEEVDVANWITSLEYVPTKNIMTLIDCEVMGKDLPTIKKEDMSKLGFSDKQVGNKLYNDIQKLLKENKGSKSNKEDFEKDLDTAKWMINVAKLEQERLEKNGAEILLVPIKNTCIVKNFEKEEIIYNRIVFFFLISGMQYKI
jgi:hypothetical protein